MASPSTSSAPAIPPKYEYLKSLCDIQTIRDLTEDAVRDILRNKGGLGGFRSRGD